MHIVILDSLFTTYSNLSTKFTIYSYFSLYSLYNSTTISILHLYLNFTRHNQLNMA